MNEPKIITPRINLGAKHKILRCARNDPALNYAAPSYANLLLGSGHGGRCLICAGQATIRMPPSQAMGLNDIQ